MYAYKFKAINLYSIYYGDISCSSDLFFVDIRSLMITRDIMIQLNWSVSTLQLLLTRCKRNTIVILSGKLNIDKNMPVMAVIYEYKNNFTK